MQLRYSFRLYPTPTQGMALASAFGCARVVFNDGLRAREEARHSGQLYVKDSELQRRVITEAKKTPARTWLTEVSSVVLVQALRDLHNAYRNFFDSAAGRRGGPRIRPPRFRSRKDTRQSIRLTRNGFVVRPDGRLYLAKIGDVKVTWSRALPAAPSSVTVIKDSAGRYFASFVVEVERTALPEVDQEIGLDLGLTSFAVDSRGKVITNPRFLRNHERRLRRAQKSLSRKAKGSTNRAKARLRVARAYAKVADCRRNWLHQETTRLIRENQAIYLEDLAVAGLARTRLAKSVHDASWGRFRLALEQKARQYGRYVGVIGRFTPTSQVCSACGNRAGVIPLCVRVWTCQACASTHDRDHNAAKNILAAGRAERINACGAQVRPEAISALRNEAGTALSPLRRVVGIPPAEGGVDVNKLGR